jgi:hypothetical protein
LFSPKWNVTPGLGRIGTTISVLVTFLAVVSAQVFFRADSVQDAFAVLRGAIGVNGIGPVLQRGPGLSAWVALGLLLGGIWWLPNTQEILGQYSGEEKTQPGIFQARFHQWQPTWRWSLAISAAFFACFVLMKPASRFLYFQF